MGTYRTYIEKLRDPRWQRLRLKCLEKAEWTCSWCGDKKSNLQVHHGYYRKGATPWSYPQKTLHVLCEGCHGRAEWQREELYRMIAAIHPSKIAVLATQLSQSANMMLADLDFDKSNDGESDSLGELQPEDLSLTQSGLSSFFGNLKQLLEDDDK